MEKTAPWRRRLWDKTRENGGAGWPTHRLLKWGKTSRRSGGYVSLSDEVADGFGDKGVAFGTDSLVVGHDALGLVRQHARKIREWRS